MKKPGRGRVFHDEAVAQAAGLAIFFLPCFLAAACFFMGMSFFISSFFAIGAIGAAAGAVVCAKAPMEKAEAMITAMSLFMMGFLQGMDERAECSQVTTPRPGRRLTPPHTKTRA